MRDEETDATDATDATTTLTRRTFLRGAAAGGVVAFAPPFHLAARAAGGTLTAGAASTDITPENGGEFFGYVRPDIRADGVSIRLQAHALVLDDGVRKLALVAVDLGEPMVKDAVVDRVRYLGYDEETVLVAATHTHAGPNEVDDWTAHQIARAIVMADERLQPARAGWGTAELPDGNVNRAVEAHLANHGFDLPPGEGSADLDPEGQDHTRDTVLRLLRVEATDGTPIAAWTHFAAHPTTYIPSNTTFSADFPGVATRRFRAAFDGPVPIAMFTNGNEGDMIPLYDDHNQHAVADRMGLRVAGAMAQGWHDARRSLRRRLPIDARRTTVTFQGQEVEPGRRVAAYVGYFGASFFGGAKNGPSPFYEVPGMEGRRRPAALADPVHGRKIIASPAPWFPTLELQAIRVGDRLLLGLPGEPTVEIGRRIRVAVESAAPEGIGDIAIIGLANGMHGYFTTPEEYDQQHYEGGHTVFGKWSALLLEQGHAGLAAALASGRATGPEPAGSEPEPVAPPTGDGRVPGRLVAEPPAVVARLETVAISWQGGLLGLDRPTDEPFIVLERRDGSGHWHAVDDDLGGWAFVWRERAGEHTARYEVAHGAPTGPHRLRVRSARYELETRVFEIVPAATLRLLGVIGTPHGAGTRLTFHAQHPPPDPERHLRTRPVVPRGGTLRFRIDGDEHRADWDDQAGGWVATVDRVEDGAAVEVPSAGLVDRYGNTSGEARTLRVGELDEVEWPPPIGPAGDGTPGPANIGTWPSEPLTGDG